VPGSYPATMIYDGSPTRSARSVVSVMTPAAASRPFAEPHPVRAGGTPGLIRCWLKAAGFGHLASDRTARVR
jgi:hypothetical protein